MLLIGLHGVQQAGKDTASNFVKDWAVLRGYTHARRGLADEMKLALARICFGEQDWLTMEWAVNWCDSLKNSFGLSDQFTVPLGGGREEAVPMRDFMRHIGTDLGRRLWGEDFWVDKLLPLDVRPGSFVRMSPIDPGVAANSSDMIWPDNFFLPPGATGLAGVPADICCITDVRFENECRRIKRLGGVLWKLRRPVAEDRVIAEAYKRGKTVHVSDLLLDDALFDRVFAEHGDVLKIFHDHVFNEMDILANERKIR